MWCNKIISLPTYSRGFHLITHHIVEQVEEIKLVKSGIVTLLLQHTSASLSLNENADSTVMSDLESVFNRLVPENQDYYQHIFEGSDDLPAHIKSSLLGVSLSIPIRNGKMVLGQWQGIVLGEHRNQSGTRTIALTVQGQAF